MKPDTKIQYRHMLVLLLIYFGILFKKNCFLSKVFHLETSMTVVCVLILTAFVLHFKYISFFFFFVELYQ